MLDFLSRYAKTDFHYIFKGSSVLMIGQMGVSLVAFGSSVAFANLLPKTEFGVYQYILATIELILIFSLTGIGRALTVSIARELDGSYQQAFLKSLIFGVPAIILGIVVGAYYLLNGNLILGIGIALGTTAMLFVTNFKLYIPFLNGKKLFALSSIFSFLNILIASTLVIITLFHTDNILIILGVFLTSNVIVNAALYFYTNRFLKNNIVDKTLISRSTHLSAQGIISHLATQADRIMLFQFAGPVILAEYWLAQNVQRQFSHLFKSTKAIVIPKISNQSISKLRMTLMRKVLLLFVVIIPFTVAYVISIPIIFKLFFFNYLDSVIYAQFFGILFLFLPFKIIGDVFIGHGMNSTLYKITLISSTTKLITTVGLVPFYGIWGVIISTTLDQLIYTIIVLWYFYKLK